MADVEITFEVDLDGAGDELERLQHPPYDELDGVLLTTMAITEARVHTESGALRASGHQTSEHADDIWSGTLSFDNVAGIMELARGDRKTGGEHVYWTKGSKIPRITHTQEHGGPSDSHFFFDPVEARYPGDWTTGDSFQMYTRVIETWLGMEG